MENPVDYVHLSNIEIYDVINRVEFNKPQRANYYSSRHNIFDRYYRQGYMKEGFKRIWVERE